MSGSITSVRVSLVAWADKTMKRRWFQFNLSTAIVGMMAAGMLMWVNSRAHYRLVQVEIATVNQNTGTDPGIMPESPNNMFLTAFTVDRIHCFGWPLTIVEGTEHTSALFHSFTFDRTGIESGLKEIDINGQLTKPTLASVERFQWHRTNIFINAAVGIAIVLSMMLAFEFLNPRFRIRKPKWLRIHFSTVVAGVMTALAISWCLFREQPTRASFVRGWPLHVTVRAEPATFHWPPEADTIGAWDMIKPEDWKPDSSFFLWRGMIVDGLLVCLPTIFVCLLIERRTRRKSVQIVVPLSTEFQK